MGVYKKYKPVAVLPSSLEGPATTATTATDHGTGPRGVATVATVATPNAIVHLFGDDEADERAAICEYDGTIPREWAVGFALLLSAPCPLWLTDDQWKRHHDAAGKLLACWAAQMSRLGWGVSEVLGVDPKWPGKAWEPSCLLSALVGVTIGAVSKDRISISFADGGARCLERHSGKWVYA